MSPSLIVQKLWNYCNVLRDDGMSYGDYVEQLTYLLFLKMADERTKAPYNQKSIIPKNYDWPSLIKEDGVELFDHYRHSLEKLGNEKGLLGLIFSKSQNKFQDPAKLRRLIVDLIDNENWSVMSADVKGDAYEGLLEKNAQDVKTGAGQYFTPRPLIQAIVDAVNPQPGETICDPACRTGGFIIAAHDYIVAHNPNMSKKEKQALKDKSFKGWELVQGAARLCAMNLMLHGIGGSDDLPIIVNDSLASHPGVFFDIVLTNPPFGKKSSTTIVNGDGKVSKEKDTIEREDFWSTTSNKQLNFVQHVKSILKQNGRAAVVVPDNVLFEGGAGENIRRKLLHECDVHTLLRLTTGLFYAQGEVVHELYEQVIKEIDCKECCNCCRQIPPTFEEDDIEGMARGLGISPSEFESKYLKEDDDQFSDDLIFNSLPCPFLNNNLCTCYDFRPEACRSFPHLHKDEFVFRLTGVVQNYEICPIVFNPDFAIDIYCGL